MSSARSVVSSAKLIALCTLLSRVTGLIRDILLARAFGLGWVQDAFVYAFAFPNLFRRLFGEGAMAPAFVPTFTRTLEQDGRDAAWRLLAHTLALLTVAVTVVIAIVLVIIGVAWVAAPADPAQAEPRRLLLGLTALMLPFMLSICVLALLSSILNCVGSFVPAALAPILLNVGMIAGVAWLAPALFPGRPTRQVYVVAGSVLAAGVLQVACLLPALRRHGVPLGWRLSTRDPAVRHMLRLLVPVALGQGVLAFGVFLDQQLCTMLTHVPGGPAAAHWLGVTFAYPLSEGALSAVSYAQRLYQFPLGVLVISLATAALPAFARHAARGEWTPWLTEVRQSLRLAVFEGVLAGTLMIVLAEPITRLLFERGRFTPDDTARTAHVLVYYGLGLWAFCAQHIVTRAFYSLGDVQTPLRISVVLLPANFALSLALVWRPEVREAAFAVSSTVTSSAAVIAGLLILRRRRGTAVVDRATLLALAKMVWLALVTAAVLLPISAVASARLAGVRPVLLGRALETLGPLALGTGVFLAGAYALRLNELTLLLPRRRRRMPSAGAEGG